MADRLARRERWESFFSPGSLAAAGAAVSLAFLFQRSLPVRAAMFLAFLCVVRMSGKRVSFLTTILVSAGIVAANLLVPVGRVIVSLGPVRITETALLDGIDKALVFEGLVYISKASILPGLRLPGRFGSLVASSFVYYDRIVEYKGNIRPASLVEDADRLMLKVWEEPLGEDARPKTKGRTKPATALALCAVVLGSYALLLVK
jgi:hypothetical protein